MGFWSDLFGGPDRSEVTLAGNASTLAQEMNSAFQTQFANQGQILQNLNAQLSPVANLGVSQFGFSPEELNALNTQAINTTAAAARNAQQRSANLLAGQGQGGTSGLTSGIAQQIQGAEAIGAQNQLSSELLGITAKGYETGRENFFKATEGERALAGLYNPSAYASEALTSNQQALADAQKIRQERQAAAFAPISLGMKALETGLTFGAGGLANLDTAGTSSFGEQVGNFFGGGMNALSGGGE
jgi:hypothetical protein